jgi:hypothetical protein
MSQVEKMDSRLRGNDREGWYEISPLRNALHCSGRNDDRGKTKLSAMTDVGNSGGEKS